MIKINTTHWVAHRLEYVKELIAEIDKLYSNMEIWLKIPLGLQRELDDFMEEMDKKYISFNEDDLDNDIKQLEVMLKKLKELKVDENGK